VSVHPEPTLERLLSLAIAIDGLPGGPGSIDLHFTGGRDPEKRAAEHDRYTRLVDSVDAMLWVSSPAQIDHQVFGLAADGTIYEAWQIGRLQVYGPTGCTPFHDRFETARAQSAIDRLASVKAPDVPAKLQVVAPSESVGPHLSLVTGDDAA